MYRHTYRHTYTEKHWRSSIIVIIVNIDINRVSNGGAVYGETPTQIN